MSTPTVGIAGAGVAVEAATAALADAETAEVDAREFAGVDLGVVVDDAGAETFERANSAAREGETPWLAVELGGVGGRPLPEVEAAVSGFAPATACYECLRTRVEANLDDGSDADDGDGDEATPGTDAPTARLAGALAGREAATLLSGGESAILGGVIEVPHAERRVLPVPDCGVCGDARDRTLARDHAESTLEESLARAERAVDDRVGLVSSIGEAESFPAPYYLAELADTTGFSDARAAEQAAGVAADWNEGLMKALGEALERYAAGVYRESEFRVARPADVDSAVAPAEFVRPGDAGAAQSGDWAAPAPDEAVAWVRGADLATGDSVDLPAEFVHFPPPEVRHRPSITTGLGLGNSTVEALLSGLYEAVERDATMLAWYSTFEPLGLSVDSERFETLSRRARAENLDVTAMLVTQDVDVPVVAVAVHRDREEWPAFAVGSDADLDPDAAAESALAEALQNWMELRSMGREDAADSDGAIGRYAGFPESAREFVSVETTVPSDSVGPAEVPEGTAELDAVLDRLADADLSAFAARLTTRDVASLGFEAVRVLVPDAQPLFTGTAYFGERARTVPAELGFEFRPDRELHPYP
ncbi:YcaO-like family protein [Halorussus salilacus]|uniref:YcaO-like family protein n=1 Tax=Halorussus salilacus TaxID=2953750 RepID=UPI00209FA17E|nr:YcaO-like family protein [Halorussus salilacus]USZ67881.1 YcaO-like family protein [Halorussus salilacus]